MILAFWIFIITFFLYGIISWYFEEQSKLQEIQRRRNMGYDQ